MYFSKEAFSDQSTAVFMRFAGVFAQTYRRYLDLQNAEALALDTVKRSSVDRVRAEIASMRTRERPGTHHSFDLAGTDHPGN
jgi:hypothetical protein